jgi:hypothetical protein
MVKKILIVRKPKSWLLPALLDPVRDTTAAPANSAPRGPRNVGDSHEADVRFGSKADIL